SQSAIQLSFSLTVSIARESASKPFMTPPRGEILPNCPQPASVRFASVPRSELQCARLHRGAQAGPVAEREENLRAKENRRDEDLEQVVDERRPAPLEHVADELQDPAADEEHAEPGPGASRAAGREQLGEPDERAEYGEHRHRKGEIENEVIRQQRGGGQHGRG